MACLTFIHGMGNKPSPEELVESWRSSLSLGTNGFDLERHGVAVRMVYWADVLYERPLPSRPEHESIADHTDEMTDPGDDWQTGLAPAEAKWLERLTQTLDGKAAGPCRAPAVPSDASLERVPLPQATKKALMRTFLRDVHHYGFDSLHSPRPDVAYRVRAEIRRRTVNLLHEAADRPHVVVAHSMGTIIAYDCLKRVPDCPAIDALITLGSPLGLDEVQDLLRPETTGGDGWTPSDGFPSGKLRHRWVNVYDHYDVVAALDPRLANDFLHQSRTFVEDINEQNSGGWRHGISKYLAGPILRGILGEVLGI